MSERIPCISLWQPWANWVSLGWKPIETRTHKRFAKLVGQRIGIHVSLKWDDTAIEQARPYLEWWQIKRTEEFLRCGGAICCTALVADFSELDWSFSKGALIDCSKVKRYGLFLSDIRHPEMHCCKGRQGIWYEEIEEGATHV